MIRQYLFLAFNGLVCGTLGYLIGKKIGEELEIQRQRKAFLWLVDQMLQTRPRPRPDSRLDLYVN